MKRYDKNHPDPLYHDEWGRRYARRARIAAFIAIALGCVSMALAIYSLVTP